MLTTERTHLSNRGLVAVALAAASIGVAAPGQAATTPTDTDALQALLDSWRVDNDVFGATLSIRVPGDDDIHLASGLDDRTLTSVTVQGEEIEHTETSMPTDGTFNIFSETKAFVAAAALQLVDEGSLELDGPVAEWLPELPNDDEITLAMLLDHTSGLGSWTGAPEESPDFVATILEDLTRSFAPDEVLAKHLEQPPVDSPGERFHYGNVGTDAVGVIIERVLDQRLADVLAERFIEPLGLDDTFLSDGTVRPTRHGWFSLDGDPDRTLDWLDAPHEAVMTSLYAAGGMTSTSADLLDWGEALYSGDVLGPEMTATMIERQLGTFCVRGCGLVAKGGGAPWTEVLAAHHVDSGITIVVHANTDPGIWLVPLAVDAIRTLGVDVGDVVAAGTHTTEQFQPAIGYTVPAGWELDADEPGVFALFTDDEVSGGLIVIADPVALHPDPQDTADAARAAEGVGRSADELLAWLVDHPELDVTEPVPITVGGFDAIQLDVRIAEGSTSSPSYCDVDACVDVIGRDLEAAEQWIFFLYGMDDVSRVVLFETDGGVPVAIIADPWDDGDPVAVEAFMVQAQAIIDSITFE